MTDCTVRPCFSSDVAFVVLAASSGSPVPQIQRRTRLLIKHLRQPVLNLARSRAHKAGAGGAAAREGLGSQRAECPTFVSQLWHCKIWNEPPLTSTPLLHQYSAIMAPAELLMQPGNPYFCHLPHLKCNQRHNRESSLPANASRRRWNRNQHLHSLPSSATDPPSHPHHCETDQKSCENHS